MTRTPRDLAGARPGPAFTVRVDGREVDALPGQTLAAVLWADGTTAWRTTRVGGRPRGAFCGIGSCFDCLITVNGVRDLRACLVRPEPGDVVSTRDDD
ncbi:(2Fe-2S)-binding protein [Yinghuangia seranimata]|uniref:(2Fe-2S)-binding protein n=1 Tax=Yinghuangia seranimata TaxID=408067 RepID=UPI00248CB339|nr:(2Fe-2S)-binding protein [Yinghuangia seranimata]MDI2132048.1 (2Fe-2S)-binding protein [Yinghuangia seranimata]